MLGKILENKQHNSSYHHMTIWTPEIAQVSIPGQFVMIRISENSFDPLLRRPISIMDASDSNGCIQIFYKIVGRGTSLLSKQLSDTMIDLVGPLGKGFRLPDSDKGIILIGGGIGLPPLYFLARKLKERSNSKVTVIIGAKSTPDLLLIDQFKALGASVIISTDDGSLGIKGTAVEALEITVKEISDSYSSICACGPKGMLKAVKLLADKVGCPAQLSLENVMGCGVGACLGCIVQTTSGPQRICADGPVFDADVLLDW